MTRVFALTEAARADLPPPCVSCVFWQHERAVTDERRKEAWVDSFERRHGAFGRVIHDDGDFRGMVQYGPASAFPRARLLPAGPPSRDAALITCTYMTGDDPEGNCERLLLEALADLKARGVAAVEAFALGHHDDVPRRERFLGHHTLFDREFLAALGFAPARAHGHVCLMRIELGSLVPGPAIAERARRALARARIPRTRPATA
ncbi:MAG: hypothetical protein AB7V42_05950 [Thermoleophilia bacterium]